jgi:aldehyde dehydrogenase (NAD+)
VVNPATGEEIGRAPDGSGADVAAAVAAARSAFDETEWSRDHAFRVHCLSQLHAALVENGPALRALTTAEAGAPAFLTTGPQYDVPVESLAWTVDLAAGYAWEGDLGVARPMGIATRRTIRREATGVVAAITPWNFPNQITLAKLGPALAAGNTVVLKPAPDTAWLACELGRLAATATDLPPGVLNVVTPRDNTVAAVLTSDPAVDLVSFTGSTATGRAVMAGRRADAEEGVPRARRQVRRDRARRRGPRGGGGQRGVLGVHPRRPGMRAHHPAAGPAGEVRRGRRDRRGHDGGDRDRRPGGPGARSAGR